MSVDPPVCRQAGSGRRPRHSLSDVPPENWARRKITNSAGFTGAMPMSTMSWPASIVSAVLFSPSHLTKNASAGVAPEERAVAPGPDEEGPDRPLDALPEVHVVGLEDDPLGAEEDRLLDVVEEAPDVEVAPRRVGGERAGAPDADPAPGEGADAVDPDRVELVLLGPGEVQLQGDRPADDLVRRRLVDAALAVVAGPDAGDVAGRAARTSAWPATGSKTLIHGQ